MLRLNLVVKVKNAIYVIWLQWGNQPDSMNLMFPAHSCPIHVIDLSVQRLQTPTEGARADSLDSRRVLASTPAGTSMGKGQSTLLFVASIRSLPKKRSHKRLLCVCIAITVSVEAERWSQTSTGGVHYWHSIVTYFRTKQIGPVLKVDPKPRERKSFP